MLATTLALPRKPIAEIRDIKEPDPNVRTLAMLNHESTSKMEQLVEDAINKQNNIKSDYEIAKTWTATDMKLMDTPDGSICFHSRKLGLITSDETNAEFEKNVGIYIQNPTFDDVRKALMQNPNIPEEYKEKIRISIDQIQRTTPNFPCHSLYYNIGVCKIRIITQEEIAGERNKIISEASRNEIDEKLGQRNWNSVLPDWEPNTKTLVLEENDTQESINYKIKKMTSEGQDIYCQSIQEFGRCVGLDIENPTYEDVRRVLDENPNISEDFKEKVRISIDQLENVAPTLPCDVLYYNMKSFIINTSLQGQVNNDELNDWKGINAFWNKETQTLSLEENSSQEVINHEASHMATEGQYGSIFNSTNLCIATIYHSDDEKASVVLSRLGKSLEEGKAILIEQQNNPDFRIENYGEVYRNNAELLRVLLKISGMSLDDFMKQGTRGLIEELNRHGVNYGASIIEMADFRNASSLNGINIEEIDKEGTFPEIVITTFHDYADFLFTSGKSKEEVLEIIEEIMSESLIPEDRLQQFNYDIKGAIDKYFQQPESNQQLARGEYDR